MPLLEYRIDPPPPSAEAYPYRSDLWRARGERFAIFRVDAQQAYPRPYWLTRTQLAALHAMLAQVLAEWPIGEPHPDDTGLQSPARGERPDVLAR